MIFCSLPVYSILTSVPSYAGRTDDGLEKSICRRTDMIEVAEVNDLAVIADLMEGMLENLGLRQINSMKSTVSGARRSFHIIYNCSIQTSVCSLPDQGITMTPMSNLLTTNLQC